MLHAGSQPTPPSTSFIGNVLARIIRGGLDSGARGERGTGGLSRAGMDVRDWRPAIAEPFDCGHGTMGRSGEGEGGCAGSDRQRQLRTRGTVTRGGRRTDDVGRGRTYPARAPRARCDAAATRRDTAWRAADAGRHDGRSGRRPDAQLQEGGRAARSPECGHRRCVRRTAEASCMSTSGGGGQQDPKLVRSEPAAT